MELHRKKTDHLFPHVTIEDNPENALSEEIIRNNLVHLIWRFWGKKYSSDHAEVSNLYNLLKESQAIGLSHMSPEDPYFKSGVSNYLSERGEQDPQYIMRAWSTVLIYLINDDEFLYE